MSFLPVRRVASRERAEELDLLLQSLGIDARLSFDEQAERGPWVIEVEASHHAEAQRLIDEEEVEPTPVLSEPMLGARSGLYWVAGLVLINALVWWAMEQRGGSQDHATLLRFGAVNSALLAAGEWWRTVTAIFLHIGARHLIGNMAYLGDRSHIYVGVDGSEEPLVVAIQNLEGVVTPAHHGTQDVTLRWPDTALLVLRKG